MIFIKTWRRYDGKNRKPIDYKGVFLFGILPLYIKRTTYIN